MTQPKITDLVHYVAYGTPGGEYPTTCRAAVVTEVGQWVTVTVTEAESYSRSEGRPIRTVEQWFHADAVALTVLNPTGVFLNGAGHVACRRDVPVAAKDLKGGTWHPANSCPAGR